MAGRPQDRCQQPRHPQHPSSREEEGAWRRQALRPAATRTTPRPPFIANAWTINCDEAVYKARADESLCPSASLANAYGVRTAAGWEVGGRRALYAFGSGWRQCPGEQFAFTAVIIAVAELMWAYDILPGPRGADVSIETGYKDGVVTTPVDPQVTFRLRSEDKRAALVEDSDRTDAIARELLG